MSYLALVEALTCSLWCASSQQSISTAPALGGVPARGLTGEPLEGSDETADCPSQFGGGFDLEFHGLGTSFHFRSLRLKMAVQPSGIRHVWGH